MAVRSLLWENQYIERVLLLFRFVVTGPKQRLFPLALQIKPTVCNVVSYVCLSQQYKGQFGQYKLFFSDESAEIILLRLEKWIVWNMKYLYVSVTLTGQRYDVLIYCKCNYTTYLMLNCNKDTTEKSKTQFCKWFLLVVLKICQVCFFSLSFIISYSTCHKSINQ